MYYSKHQRFHQRITIMENATTSAQQSPAYNRIIENSLCPLSNNKQGQKKMQPATRSSADSFHFLPQTEKIIIDFFIPTPCFNSISSKSFFLFPCWHFISDCRGRDVDLTVHSITTNAVVAKRIKYKSLKSKPEIRQVNSRKLSAPFCYLHK